MTMRGHTAYLDYNATAPLRPQAREALERALLDGGNPSSVHTTGRRARAHLERARRVLAGLVGSSAEAVTFVSGATEANAMVLGTAPGPILAAATEHDSVLAWAAGPAALGPANHELVSVDRDGVIDLADLDRLLMDCGATDGPPLVSVMAVNNETGVVQPLAEVCTVARRHGALVHCDAAQALGRVVLMEAVGEADYVTLSAHKAGGPPGMGAIVHRGGPPPIPLLRGGGQERGRRPGTEAVWAVAGFGAAAQAAAADLENGEASRQAALRMALESELAPIAGPDAVAGAQATRTVNTTCLAMPGVSAETQLMALDLEGIAVSAGSACSSGKVRRSHVLRAMGRDEEESGCFIRISMGWDTAEADVARFCEAWKRLRARTVDRAAE